GDYSLNDKLARWIGRLHELCGLDVNDRRITWMDDPFRVPYQPWNEDETGAPVQFLLSFAIPMLALLFFRRHEMNHRGWLVLGVGWVGFVLIAAMIQWM